MKPTVKSFLALAEDKEQTVHIARFKSDNNSKSSTVTINCAIISLYILFFNKDSKFLSKLQTIFIFSPF